MNTRPPIPTHGVDHYENFPVASWLCPRRLRRPVVAIYGFARTADDLADEGATTPAQRLSALAAFRSDLEACFTDRPDSGRWPFVFIPLRAAVRDFSLPHGPLGDLLTAFEQDVAKSRDGAGYGTRAELLDYCRRSADPVGRLLLHLYGITDAAARMQSDAVCTALQLINFWQDVGVDSAKGRIYIPLDDLARFGVDEAQIGRGVADRHWRALMQFEVERARSLMHAGAPLARRLPGRVGWELRLVIQGGLRILERIEQADYDVFRRRPSLGKADWLTMLGRALRM